MLVTRHTIASLLLGFSIACSSSASPSKDPDGSTEPEPNAIFEPAEQSKGDWVWIPVADSVCRDGSTTGIGVRLLDGAQGLMIYMQGGGACYDAQSCEENANAGIAGASFSSQAFSSWVAALGDQGVFNTAEVSNPVGTWNHVYIPYCTGDLHGGDNEDVSVVGVDQPQQFVGYRNMTTFLALLAPYFGDSTDIALAGASAGGFGVMFNYPQVADSFESLSVTALVDAAPLFETADIVTSCFQEKLMSTFNLQLPASCTGCDDPTQGGLVNLYGFLRESHPDGQFSFASADGDIVGVALLDRESRACGGGGVNIINYRLALDTLRESELEPAGWSSFYWGGLQHTMTQSDALFFENKIDDRSAAEWFRDVLSGSVIHIAP